MPDDNQIEELDINEEQELTLEGFAQEIGSPATFEQLAETIKADDDPEVPEEPQEDLTALDIDGEKIPADQLKELVSKGKDYTRKTMELAEQRKQLEQEASNVKWIKELEQAWNSGPEGKAHLIEALMAEAGYSPPPQSQPIQLDMDDLSDEAKQVLQVLQGENQKLQRQLSHVTTQSAQAIKQFEDYLNEQKGTDAASTAAASLKAEFGVDVSTAELRQIAKDTGISDYEAAWLKVNKELVKKGLFQAGHEQGKRHKPNTPAGQTKTFDANAKGMTADKMVSYLMKGYVPK